ncbi:MAG: translation initiation factor IF-3 [Chloroflexi bacterium]|nr:translation initiation factor IF-3 [Chloroflexota bacterium]
MSSREHRINEAITASEVRLVDETGKQMGVFPIREALRIAQERDLDLVEVAPAANPPVCRLLNYGKFIYERTKKERLARKSQRTVEIKEIRMHPKIGAHDLAFKTRRVREFLADGAKVRLRVRFRGRERSYPEIGRDLLERLAAELADVATVEQAPTMEEGAKSVFLLLAPKPSARRSESQRPATPEKPKSDESVYETIG